MKPAVVLMAYGSPTELSDIRPYLEDIRGGRPVSDEAVEELTERYRRIGGRSPLDHVTEAQRAALRWRRAVGHADLDHTAHRDAGPPARPRRSRGARRLDSQGTVSVPV